MSKSKGKDRDPEKPAEKAGKLSRKEYEKELRRLHVELVKLQRWVVHKGLKVCVVFEGRDGAGKGGTIKALTERVSSRVFRVVALPAPTERERSQMYMQRYFKHLPAAGEVVVFDRSWYNRAGVEPVLGYCTAEETAKFLNDVAAVERYMIDTGIILLKYWLEVTPEMQQRRLEDRIDDGRKTWKLTASDIKSYHRWDEYTRARDQMFEASDTPWAPWFVARSVHERRMRLNVISHLLEHIAYEDLPLDDVKLGKRKVGEYKPVNYPFKYIPERF